MYPLPNCISYIVSSYLSRSYKTTFYGIALWSTSLWCSPCATFGKLPEVALLIQMDGKTWPIKGFSCCWPHPFCCKSPPCSTTTTKDPLEWQRMWPQAALMSFCSVSNKFLVQQQQQNKFKPFFSIVCSFCYCLPNSWGWMRFLLSSIVLERDLLVPDRRCDGFEVSLLVIPFDECCRSYSSVFIVNWGHRGRSHASLRGASQLQAAAAAFSPGFLDGRQRRTQPRGASFTHLIKE